MYHLKREGYECVATDGELELWVHPDKPPAVIDADPPMPESVRRALVEYLEENWDKPIPPSPGTTPDDE